MVLFLSVLRQTVFPSIHSFSFPDASRANHCTGLLGSAISGVSTPISLTRLPSRVSKVSQRIPENTGSFSIGLLYIISEEGEDFNPE
jgi:hypothetical protein